MRWSGTRCAMRSPAGTCSPKGAPGSPFAAARPDRAGAASVAEELVQRQLEAGELRRRERLTASELERDVERRDLGRRAAEDEHGLCHIVDQPELGHPAGLVARLLGADVVTPRPRRADLDAELGHACEALTH